MPPLGQTTEDLKILRWLKSEGDQVRLGEELLEVETDKATLIVESFLSGSLLKIIAPEGAIVQAGDVVALVGSPGEMVPVTAAESGSHAMTGDGLGPAVDASRVTTPAEQISNASPGDSPQPGPGRVLASPAARKLARTHALDVTAIKGTGVGGRIEVQDVLRAAGIAKA